MATDISLPLWAFVLLLALAGWAALDRLLLPGVRFFVRRRANRVIDEVNRRLSVRIQPFKLTKRQVLVDRLTYDPEVLAAVEELAAAEDVPREVLVERVERYAREIVPYFNAWVYFRVGYRLARAAARLLYRVRVGSVDEEALASIPPDATVVLVMNHRSNLDYVLVAYLVADRTALSYAVGEWARVWPLESLIKAMGAYFVRRGSDNPLYRKVLERYVAMATAEGVTQAIYPEGGLSRDGRLRSPKLGLLDYLLRSFDPRGERDVVFVPVGLNYDRVLEDRTLLLDAPETDGAAGRRERRRAVPTTLGFLARNLWLMVRSRWHRFGYACVDVGTPLSLRAFLAERDLGGAGAVEALERSQRFVVTAALAEELMGAIGAVVPVVPVSLVASVFVDAHGAPAGARGDADEPRPGLSRLEIKSRATALLGRLEAAGARVYVPRQDREYALEVGLRTLTLRHLVVEEDGLFHATPDELATLSYYARSIEHLRP